MTDQNGKVVGEGGMNQVLPPMAEGPSKCCDDILKRLDKLDDIAKMLRDLADQNAGPRREVGDLKQQEQALEAKVNGLPKPLNEQQTSEVVDKRLEANRDPRFSLLGLNAGADDMGRITFTGSGRYFAPFKDHFAVQAQAEYLYFHDQKEGQGDIGLVNRFTDHLQGGLFASFKHVNLAGYGSGGTLGEGSACSITSSVGAKLGFSEPRASSITPSWITCRGARRRLARAQPLYPALSAHHGPSWYKRHG